MRPFGKIYALVTLVLGIGLASNAANLITNGSFESGNFVPSETGSMLLSAGATDMTGWTVINGGLAWDSQADPYGLTASDGSYFLDLTGDYDQAPYGGVAQAVTTAIGSQYQLTFDVGTSTTYDNNSGLLPVSIAVSADSSSGIFTTATPSSINQWQSFSFDFTATSTSTLISLDGQASANIEYIGLDNVSLTAVPEPSTLMLSAAAGLVFLATSRRLRKA